mmetsp:Transcript_37074/g.47270  ORF Transcript_37074/g.47270 Transcript_37074/m.47270 type:complete len:135 (+) Transcript_37074:1671-2075(+)
MNSRTVAKANPKLYLHPKPKPQTNLQIQQCTSPIQGHLQRNLTPTKPENKTTERRNDQELLLFKVTQNCRLEDLNLSKIFRDTVAKHRATNTYFAELTQYMKPMVCYTRGKILAMKLSELNQHLSFRVNYSVFS